MTATTHAERLRAEIERIERHGHAGLGYPLEPHDIRLLAVMRDAADELDRLTDDDAVEA